VSANARASTVLVKVYRYRERLVYVCYRFLFYFFFYSPSIELSRFITDINKCILYKTMYNVAFDTSSIVDHDSRALILVYIYAKVQNNKLLNLFLFFFLLLFFSPKRDSNSR